MDKNNPFYRINYYPPLEPMTPKEIFHELGSRISVLPDCPLFGPRHEVDWNWMSYTWVIAGETASIECKTRSTDLDGGTFVYLVKYAGYAQEEIHMKNLGLAGRMATRWALACAVSKVYLAVETVVVDVTYEVAKQRRNAVPPQV